MILLGYEVICKMKVGDWVKKHGGRQNQKFWMKIMFIIEVDGCFSYHAFKLYGAK